MHVEEKVGDIQYVVFSVYNQIYSLRIEEVIEILKVPEITTVPGINRTIEGVINLRGNIIPVVNLYKRFNMAVQPANNKSRVVIVQGHNENIGLMVDEVKMVTRFNEHNIEPVSGEILEKEIFNGYAKHDQYVIGILDIEKLLYSQSENN